MKQLIIASVFAIILSGSAFAQGEFLQPGENGIGAAPRFFFGNNADGQAISLGVSIKGYFDIGFGYAENSVGDAKEYMGTITGHLAKRTYRKTTTAAVLSFGYDVIDFKNAAPYGSTYHFLMVGLGGYYNYSLNRNALFAFGGNFSVVYNVDGGVLDTVKRLDFSIGAATSLVFAHQKPLRPFVTIGGAQGSLSNSEIYGYAGGGIVLAF